MPLAPGTKLGPYEIAAAIGAGGMGEVYRAHDARLGRDVALKVAAEKFSDRFEREARAVAALNHPHICQLYDVGPDYLVMELVDGKPLPSPLPLSEALAIAIQIAEALEHAHRRGVIHRDLKPANILMTKFGIKLLDFGLARTGASTLTAQDETATMGVIMGTPAYMSPEQWEGKPADARSDIFSFGAVLYELLTGKRAFEGATAASVLAAVMRDHPTGSVELTGPVEPVLRRCLAKDPEERFQTAADLKWALENLSAGKLDAAAPWVRSGPSKAAIAERFFLTLFFLLTAALGIAWFTQKPVEIPSLSFTLDAPKGTSYTNPYHATAISSDGKLVVFAASAAGDPVLWLRSLDSLDANQLPGTERANGPFFSPDGKSIGFFADGKLKRIDVAGGTAEVLCDAPLEQGGDWNQDGAILFGADGVVQRIPAGGGTPQRVTTLDPSRREIRHDLPQFLDDGRKFLYFIESPLPEVEGVYVASLDQPKGTRILAGSTRAIYAPRSRGNAGELFWMRGDALVAQRFDSDTLRLDGEPIPVLQNVAVPGALARASVWISTKGPVVYRSGGAAAMQLTWVGRDGKTSETIGVQNPGARPRLSPDGRRAALVRFVSGSYDIWVYEFARDAMTRLTFDPGEKNYPIWSPDGRQVAYTSNRSGVFQMYRKDAGGAGAEERLHEGPHPESPLDWSRDGKYLLYREENPTTRGDLMILPLEGDRKPIAFSQTPFNETFAVFSPDGKWIAYTSEETGRTEVYIRASPVAVPAAGAGLEGKWQVSNGEGILPLWPGDGKELFYRAGPMVVAAGIRVVAGRPEIDTPHALFPHAGPNDFDVAPDGQRFLMRAQPQNSDPTLKVMSNWRALVKK